MKETSKVIDAFTRVVASNVAHGREVRVIGFAAWSMREAHVRQVKTVRDGEPMSIRRANVCGSSLPMLADGCAYKKHRMMR